MRDLKTSLSPEFDVITISETFLNNNTPSSDLEMPGVHPIIRRSRTGGADGVVALYVSLALVVKPRQDLDSPNIEILWSELRIHFILFYSAQVIYRYIK